MAYTAEDLSVLAYANNFTLWHYKTDDASVIDAGYFNAAANIDVDGSPATVFYIVNASGNGSVSISAFSA